MVFCDYPCRCGNKYNRCSVSNSCWTTLWHVRECDRNFVSTYDMDYLVKLCTRQGRSEEKETKATNHNQSFILQQTNNKCVKKTGAKPVSGLRQCDCLKGELQEMRKYETFWKIWKVWDIWQRYESICSIKKFKKLCERVWERMKVCNNIWECLKTLRSIRNSK